VQEREFVEVEEYEALASGSRLYSTPPLSPLDGEPTAVDGEFELGQRAPLRYRMLSRVSPCCAARLEEPDVRPSSFRESKRLNVSDMLRIARNSSCSRAARTRPPPR